jgi:hypothetical protein
VILSLGSIVAIESRERCARRAAVARAAAGALRARVLRRISCMGRGCRSTRFARSRGRPQPPSFGRPERPAPTGRTPNCQLPRWARYPAIAFAGTWQAESSSPVAHSTEFSSAGIGRALNQSDRGSECASTRGPRTGDHRQRLHLRVVVSRDTIALPETRWIIAAAWRSSQPVPASRGQMRRRRRPGVTAAATTAVLATGAGPGVTALATTAVLATGARMTPTLPRRAGLRGMVSLLGL